MTKNRDELLHMLRNIDPNDRVNQRKVGNGLFFLVIGCFLIIIIYIKVGFFELMNSYLSPIETLVVYFMLLLPFMLLGLAIDRFVLRSLRKTLIIKSEFIKKFNRDWILYLVILPAMMVYLYLLAFSEGIIHDIMLTITFILGAFMFLMNALGSAVGSSLGGGGGGIGEKVVTRTERYIAKNKDGKPHLFKESLLGDEDLGELHKKFGGGQETLNILGKNYEIGDKGFYRTDRDFIKKDENERGVLKEPIAGDKYLTYKSKKRTK